MQTTQNSLNKYKNVFQKTVNGNFGGFRRKITIDEGTTPLDAKSQSDESSMDRKNFASLISSKGSHDEENVMIIKDSKTNIVHLDTNIDKVGRRTQQKISIHNDSAHKQSTKLRKISAMAKTHDNGNWPREFECDDEESSPD